MQIDELGSDPASTTHPFGDAVAKTTVFPAEAPLTRIFPELTDASPQEQMLAQGGRTAPSPSSIGFYFATDMVLRGSGFLFKGEDLLHAPDLVPAYILDQFTNGGRWDAQPAHRQSRTVQGPRIVAVSDSYQVYGHWLLDILPRVWLVRRYLHDGERIPLLLPSDTPPFARAILRDQFGIPDSLIETYSITGEDVHLPQIIVPSLLHVSHYFHPAMNRFIAAVGRMAHRPDGGPSPRYLYISRSKFRFRSTSYRRSLNNEAEVERCVTGRGFSIVYPEELDWLSQVRLFSNARIVVGESGSGLHNSIFCRPGSTVICINSNNQVQGSIAALRYQDVVFLCAPIQEDDESGPAATVDIARLSAAIDLAMMVSR